MITRLLSSALAGPSAVVLIDAAGNVARQRPLLVPELLPPLLRFAQHLAAAAASSQAASMAHALKGALVQLLRSGVLASGAWQESVMGALKAMGHQEVAEQAVRQSERSMKRERTQLDRFACLRLCFPGLRPDAQAHFAGIKTLAHMRKRRLLLPKKQLLTAVVRAPSLQMLRRLLIPGCSCKSWLRSLRLHLAATSQHSVRS